MASIVQPAGEGKDGTTPHAGAYQALSGTTTRKREDNR